MIRRSGIFERKRMKKFDSASDAGLTDQNFWGIGVDGTVVISSDTTWDSGNIVNGFSLSLGSDSGNNANYSFRQVIPLSQAGINFRITIQAASGSNLSASHVSIVKQSSGINGTGTPAEITFNNGQSGFSITGGGSITSDLMTFSLEAANYIIIIDVSSNGYLKFGSSASCAAYQKANTQSWDQQSVSGFSSLGAYAYGVSKIEVGTGSFGGEMIVKNFTDFTVNSGVTLTIKARKGCLVYVSGNCVINGTIWIKSGYACNPSDAGVPSDGLVIARRKTGSTESGSSILTGCGTAAINSEAGQMAISANGKKYTIPRTGASGGASKTNGAGNPGTAGSGIQTGGGGGGGARSASSGTGAAGTCFSGGGGGAGSNTVTSGSAAPYGGRGGDATDGGAGGAGNPGGSAGGSYSYAGGDGIGGVLILFVKGNLTIASGAYIKANGAKGGNINDNLVGSGGGSGGGIIIVLYAGILSNSGTVQSLGGAGGDPIGYSNPDIGGSGGAGTTLLEQILR